jgi:hypothetical protein
MCLVLAASAGRAFCCLCNADPAVGSHGKRKW